jgi:hypothetical protein
MKYLNGIDDDILDDNIKLEPKGLTKIGTTEIDFKPQLQNTNLGSTNAQAKEQKSGFGEWLSKESTGELLGTGLEVVSAIRGQRQASGKAATRQEKIAKCGKKPLFGLNAKGLSKQRYDKCVSELETGTSTIIQGGNMGGYDGSKSMQNQGGGTKYLWWVLGGVAVIGIGFFAIKKFGKK